MQSFPSGLSERRVLNSLNEAQQDYVVDVLKNRVDFATDNRSAICAKLMIKFTEEKSPMPPPSEFQRIADSIFDFEVLTLVLAYGRIFTLQYQNGGGGEKLIN